jgi:hydroxyethylthiazole kinase-like uncharacterized protein yjeF
MLPVLTSAETAALDRETEARGTSVETLMERAGHAVARAAVDLAGGAYGRRAVVVCGKGNNGGDGLVAARHLSRWGMGVDLFLVAAPSGGVPAAMLDRLVPRGVAARSYDFAALSRSLDRADVAVDAMFGTGFRGSTEGRYAKAIDALNGAAAAVVAVDIPSGVEGDTGAVRGSAVRADVTVTFGAPKVGNILFPGAAHGGVLNVVDIGFPPDLVRGEAWSLEPGDVLRHLPLRPPETHKREAGVVLVVGGSRRMAGAPVLVARGAYGMGAGLVTVAVPEEILPVVQGGIPEATFLPLPQGPAGAIAEWAWSPLADRLEEFDAVAVGPGLSTGDGAPEVARRLVAQSPTPVVVDADAINAFAGRPTEMAGGSADTVITPHLGEFGRLFSVPPAEVLDDRVGFARKAAAETQAVVVLKGTRTVIAAPQGEVRINTTGTPTLASAGTGDVLTGAVAAMLSAGLPALDAAAVASFVHGLAAPIAGSARTGVLASDLARALPRAIEGLREPE